MSYYYSHQHTAYARRCTQCNIEHIGFADRTNSEKEFAKFFYMDPRNTDSLQSVCKDCVKSNKLRYRGADAHNRAELLAAQDNKCAICEMELVLISPHGKFNSAHVDHNIETGKIRGVLCHLCNSGLGYFKDDVALIRKAVKYLEDKNEDN